MNRRKFCVNLLGSGIALATLESLRPAEAADFAEQPQPLVWHRNLKEAHKLSIQTDKPMLIVFGASWCHYCHKLDRETLADKRVMAMIERDFIPIHLDFNKDAKVAKILEVESLPCTVALTPQADLLQKAVGYRDSKGYLKVLQASLDARTTIRQVQNQTP
jgi:thioredoxin-related protein